MKQHNGYLSRAQQILEGKGLSREEKGEQINLELAESAGVIREVTLDREADLAAIEMGVEAGDPEDQRMLQEAQDRHDAALESVKQADLTKREQWGQALDAVRGKVELGKDVCDSAVEFDHDGAISRMTGVEATEHFKYRDVGEVEMPTAAQLDDIYADAPEDHSRPGDFMSDPDFEDHIRQASEAEIEEAAAGFGPSSDFEKAATADVSTPAGGFDFTAEPGSESAKQFADEHQKPGVQKGGPEQAQQAALEQPKSSSYAETVRRRAEALSKDEDAQSTGPEIEEPGA